MKVGYHFLCNLDFSKMTFWNEACFSPHTTPLGPAQPTRSQNDSRFHQSAHEAHKKLDHLKPLHQAMTKGVSQTVFKHRYEMISALLVGRTYCVVITLCCTYSTVALCSLAQISWGFCCVCAICLGTASCIVQARSVGLFELHEASYGLISFLFYFLFKVSTRLSVDI